MHGLVALMELQASRSRARTGPSGEAVLLLEQDRVALGLAAGRPRPRRARPRAAHRRRPRPVHAAGRDRRLPRARPGRRRHRLGADRRPLRRARPAPAVAGRRAQPRGRRRHGVRPRGRRSSWSTRSRPSPRCAATTCCRPCAATCSRSSAATTRRGRSSSAPRRSPRTPASAQCCSSGWRPARPGTAAEQKEVFDVARHKNAVIYGGGGSIGGAVARAFGREGARVFLAGRTRAKLEEVAEAIRAAGGVAETAEVDALDEQAVDRHADAVAAEAGGIDISFNLITHPYTHGTPMAEMAVEDFMAPVETAARTTFLTARAAARHMIRQALGRDPRLRRPGRPQRPDARLLPGRHPGRVRRDRDDAAAAGRRAGAARGPGRHARERRCSRVAPRGLRGPRRRSSR